jgi:hypothetical protein
MSVEDPGGRFPFDISALWSASPGPRDVYSVTVSAPYPTSEGGGPYGWQYEVVMVPAIAPPDMTERMAKAAAESCMGWTPGEGYAPANRATVTRWGSSHATVVDLGPRPGIHEGGADDGGN